MAAVQARSGWWRSVFDPVGSSSSQTTLLSGRMLRAVRALVLAAFAAAVVVYTADLFALWDEANARQYFGVADRYDDRATYNYFGLTEGERALFGGSTPGWYPVFVVGRHVAVAVISISLAWLIFSRRPKHWMAYVTTLFVLLGPVLGKFEEEQNRLAGTAFHELSEALSWIALFVFLSFLWLFPDGRFLGSLVRLIVTVAGFVLALVLGRDLVGVFVPISGDAEDFVDGIAFLTVLVSVLIWFAVGVALQGWRYSRTPRAERRLARWNLAVLVAIPLWILPFGALHDLFSDSDVGRYTMSGFVWEQIHETLFVIAPALFGLWILFLVRRQGWWDFQTLWNRTAVYGIAVLALAALYGAALGLVSLVTAPLSSGVEQAVAVVSATAAVVFAYAPLLRRVRCYVDERWFPRRAEVDALSAAFAEQVRAEPDPSAAGDRLLGAVRAALQPAHAELWTVGGGSDR